MAINAKMLQYRGTYANFRPSVLLPGQLAVVLSGDPNTVTGKALYCCFSTGTATRILADGDVVSGDISDEQIAQAIEDYLSKNPLPSGGGFVAQPNEPTDTSVLWIDTDDDTSSGGGGGGSSENVQGDWDVNDPSNPAYTKNRTHWYKKKGLNITWDGVIGDNDTVTFTTSGVELTYYKVSDEVPQYDVLRTSVATVNVGGQVQDIPLETYWNNSLAGGAITDDFAMVEAVFVTTKDNVTITGASETINVASKGVYFAQYPNGMGYVQSLTAESEVEPLPSVFIPYVYTKAEIDEMFANFSGGSYADAEGVLF